MTKFDLNEERQRLTRLYRSLSEEELKEIAKDRGSLPTRRGKLLVRK